MQYRTTRAKQRGRGVVATVLLALALGGGLIGGLYWWSKRPALPTAASMSAAASQASDDGGAESSRDPVERADTALREKRMFVPPGDNAFELYLQVIDAQPGHAASRSALDDLFPYALLYIEERMAEGDVADATRMLDLMHRANPDAPALPRLAEALDELRTRTSMEEGARLAEQARIAALAASPPAVATAPPTPAPAATPIPADATLALQERVVEPASAPTTVPETQPAAVAENTPPPAPQPRRLTPRTPAADTLPQVVSSAQARYPAIAMRRKLEGQVELEFTVMPDGQVDDVRVLSSQPDGVFDRAAVDAMERWQFAPQQGATRSRRVFDFKLN